MRFYTNMHNYYCGIGLHAKAMHRCILDRDNLVIAAGLQSLPGAAPM